MHTVSDVQYETTCLALWRYTDTFDDACSLSFEDNTHYSVYQITLMGIVRLDVLCELQ